MAQPRVGGDHGVAQRLHDLGFHMVGEVTAGLRRGQLAPAVLDLLFLDDRVVYAGENLDVFGKDARQARARPLRVCPRSCSVSRLRAASMSQSPRHRPRIRGPRSSRRKACSTPPRRRSTVVQETLQLVGELIGLHRAHAVEERLVARKIGVSAGEERAQMSIVRSGSSPARRRPAASVNVGDPVLAVGEELGALRIGGLLVIAQARVGHDASRDPVDLLVSPNAVQHVVGRSRSASLPL